MIDNIYPGKFIVIEGLDGSGKTVQVTKLAEFLVNNGQNVLVTEEPTINSEAGRKVKEILRDHLEIDPLEFQKLYIQDRKENLNNQVIPALREGKTVISARYFFSTFAYGTAHGHNLE
ncbi:dTMP kinase [Patescibacteria group bacterium]|nr:dTMP kinase [Patescibacteria group bacterium]